MAKKFGTRHKNVVPSGPKFDDDAYEDVRFSATFDYGELSLTRAAAQLAPRSKTATTGVAFVCLAGMVAVLMISEDNLVWALVFMVPALVALNAVTNWHKLQLRYARKTTLGAADGIGRHHVVVCEDAVHTQVEGGAVTSYSLSELRAVYDTEDCVVAGFGSKRYVYVPRAALSENRFRDLVRFLREKRR